MNRLTKRDWQLINEALALLEAEHEGEEPDDAEAFADLERLMAHQDRQAQISDTRLKVHDRLDRYKDPYT